MLNSTASMLFCSASAVRRSASAWRAFVTMVCEDELADHAAAAFNAAKSSVSPVLFFAAISKILQSIWFNRAFIGAVEAWSDLLMQTNKWACGALVFRWARRSSRSSSAAVASMR